MLKRDPIRDNRSTDKIKPRVMDYIRNENGEEFLEVKDGRLKRTILLDDFENQIKAIRKNA